MLPKFKDVLEEIHDWDKDIACVELPIEEVYQPEIEKSIEELEKQGLELIKPYCPISISEQGENYCITELGKKIFIPKGMCNEESIIDILKNEEYTVILDQGNFLKKIAFCFRRKYED